MLFWYSFLHSKGNGSKYIIKMNEKDKCVLCGKATEYEKETPVDERLYYVEGAGQLCAECYNKLNNNGHDVL